MEILRDKRKTRAVQPFYVRPQNLGHQAALDAIHFWRKLDDLAGFALARRGFANCDCHAGIDYQVHLDEKTEVSNGCVAAYNGNGELDGPSYEIPEIDYLKILCQYLKLNGRFDDAGVLADFICDIAG